ncbi:phytanoyl-CoA hydroxylase-interacting protein-like [Haliotis rufescens]|uniref:phytanoyl-CoA hydroxylase-interacting protein-like n=1 Tax=Haliotis rufescens TaxID=6454 RepID=UPI00201EF613|nr:phytanoyl-CoA hydroxylase-interacting protein-like [Haliotis rufescens]
MAEGGSINDEKEYLRKLLRKAEDHCSEGSIDTVSTLYRNKPSSYFDDIRQNHNNIMEPYLKDNGGDQRCPINGRLKGLFFNVTLRNGHLPDMSPFGDTRVKMPLSEVFDDSANLYFADFYCKPSRRRVHYVTLVLTHSGSQADSFCQTHLLKLDSYTNIYLRKKPYLSGTYETLDRPAVHVEVMYTEAVNMTHRVLSLTSTFGQGHSTRGGIRKTVGCSICNVGDTSLNEMLRKLLAAFSREGSF